MLVWEIVVFAAGALIALLIVLSAVRTVAVPRGEQVTLAKVLFSVSGRLFSLLARLTRNPDRREAVRARYAPITMLMMPFVWAVCVITGFSLMFWSLGVRPFRNALVLSGSSFTTLGFRSTDQTDELLLAIGEALLGLGLIALLLSFMPALYSAFSRREALVSRLEVRAGRPPSSEEFLLRAHRIGWLDSLADTWVGWEHWFIEVEEAHTTYPALNYFRSPLAGRSWVTAAGTVLDSASLLLSTVALPPAPEASLCIRSGYVALTRIAEFFGIDYDADPSPSDPISVTREEWEAVCRRLEAEGVPLVADRDQAWRDFAGWRVNYDKALTSICELVDAPFASWSSDRRPVGLPDTRRPGA